MCTTGIRERVVAVLAGWLLALAMAQAAEVVGVVQLREVQLQEAPLINVSLLPLEGQPLPPRPDAQPHRLLVRDGRLQPSFLTLQVGDRLEIHNQDEVLHELFALSPTQPIEVSLDKHGSGAAARAEVRFVSEGVWYIFCRIHSRSHARVDVVPTHLHQMVTAGETFRFENLATGQWQLRVAAPGAETRVLRAAAVTAPPPLRIELTARAGGQVRAGPDRAMDRRIDALFPRE